MSDDVKSTAGAVRVGDVVYDASKVPVGARVAWGDLPPDISMRSPSRAQMRTADAFHQRAASPALNPFRVHLAAVEAPKPAPPTPPKCKPGCVPAAPCFTLGACPVFREHEPSHPPKGIPGDIPPARPSRWVPRCEEQLACGGLKVRR